MSSIDERIVRMKFDNTGFQSGVSSTIDSLKKLTDGLKMKGATDGLTAMDDKLQSIGKSSMNPLSASVDAVTNKFSILSGAASVALGNIMTKAIQTGSQMIKSWTLEPITSGLQEYETKMDSITTILTNTASKGTTLTDVTAALDELNTYADKTIYNFAEMTRNIGTFTAAGIDLDTSVAAIKGIANLGAGSGSNPTQVATAMYQMSQALGQGYLGLMDYNSLVNAGMGGELFKKEAIAVAESMGIAAPALEDFRESLTSDKWLTADVMMKVFDNFANNETLIDAATEVKTFTALIGTMKETMQSGWAKSWEYIFGDKEQATKLFTGINDAFSNIIGPIDDARNNLLQFWNEAGGRDAVISGLGNIMGSLGKGVGAVADAFKDIFPPLTGEKLVSISKGFLDLTEKFKLSDKAAGMIKDVFKGLFSVVDLGIDAFKTFCTVLTPLGSMLSSLGTLGLTVASSFGRFISGIVDGIRDMGLFESISNGISSTFDGMGSMFDNISRDFENLKNAIAKLNFQPLIDFAIEFGGNIGSGLRDILSGIGSVIGKINISTLLQALTAFSAGKSITNLKEIGENFASMFEDITGFTDNVTEVLDGVKDSLQAYQNDLSAGILLKLAAAIGILALSISLLSSIDQESMSNALAGISIMFMELIGGMALVMKTLDSFGKVKGIFTVNGLILSLSIALGILALAVNSLAELSWEEIAKGLTGIAGSMLILVGAVKLLGGSNAKGLLQTGISMIFMAAALKVMADAVQAFGSLDTTTLINGLLGVGAALLELAIFMKLIDSTGLNSATSVSILLLAAALLVLQQAVELFGGMDFNSMIQGLGGVAIMLAELAIFSKLSGGGIGLIPTALAMVILAGAMLLLSQAVQQMGQLSLSELGVGLLAMAGALTILGVASALINGPMLMSMGLSLIVVSGAIMLLSMALKSLGEISLAELGVALMGLAASLAILAIAMGVMSTCVVGAAAMLVMAAAMAIFVPQLMALSQLSLTEIGLGLLAMAGAFGVLGLAGLLLAPLAPVIMILAGAIALIGLSAMAAGIGITLFASGFAALGAAIAGSGFLITEMIRNLIYMLPMVGTKLAEMFTNFISTLTANVPVIIEGFGTLITAILTAFTNALPEIANAALLFITTICGVIMDAAPQLIEVGVSLILMLLQGICDNIGRIVDVGVDIVIKFINTISGKLGDIIQAGIDFALSFINGLADGIRNNQDAVSDAVLNLIDAVVDAVISTAFKFLNAGKECMLEMLSGIKSKFTEMYNSGKTAVTEAIDGFKSKISEATSAGRNLISGFIDGVKEKAGALVDSVKGAVNNAIDSAKALLGIHSPSRVFIGIGKHTIEGFVKGINKNADSATRATEAMGQGAINAMAKPLTTMSKLLDGSLDTTPTIRPVMDLSAMAKDSKTLKSMIASNEGINMVAGLSGQISSTIKPIQNGNDNSDVVSELKRVQKELGGISKPSYSIGNIAYDNNTQVAEALEILVNAAVVGRRV